MAEPLQLALFPDQASLARIRPATNGASTAWKSGPTCSAAPSSGNGAASAPKAAAASIPGPP